MLCDPVNEALPVQDSRPAQSAAALRRYRQILQSIATIVATYSHLGDVEAVYFGLRADPQSDEQVRELEDRKRDRGRVNAAGRHPDALCRATAPTGSSTLSLLSMKSAPSTTRIPATIPIKTAPCEFTNALGPVIATSPASVPLHIKLTSGLLLRTRHIHDVTAICQSFDSRAMRWPRQHNRHLVLQKKSQSPESNRDTPLCRRLRNRSARLALSTLDNNRSIIIIRYIVTKFA